MLIRPIQCKDNLIVDSTGELNKECYLCDAIQASFGEGILPLELVHNGWNFVLSKPGASNLYNSTNVAEFLHLILLEEIKNSFWCSNCASLSFTRVYASIINNETINIGFSIFPGENTIDNIELSLLKNFGLDISSDPAGSFFIYSDVNSQHDMIRLGSTEAIIPNIDNRIGVVSFDEINKKLIVNFDNKTNVIVDKIISFVISLKLSNVILNTNEIKDFDIIKANINFNDNTNKQFTGCYVTRFNNR